MRKEEIHFFDINRWLFGAAPPEFMIEVLIRTLLVFVFLLLVVKLMGSRMAGQITLTELAVMITLGAIVSPPMQIPDRGILFGILALVLTLLFQRRVNLWAFRNPKFERMLHSSMNILIKDGEIDVAALKHTRITRQQLYAILREKSIFNLGQVERVYMEADGMMSIYTFEQPRPGLPILPASDAGVIGIQESIETTQKVCEHCGHIQESGDAKVKCDICGSICWASVYLSN